MLGVQIGGLCGARPKAGHVDTELVNLSRIYVYEYVNLTYWRPGTSRLQATILHHAFLDWEWHGLYNDHVSEARKVFHATGRVARRLFQECVYSHRPSQPHKQEAPRRNLSIYKHIYVSSLT